MRLFSTKWIPLLAAAVAFAATLPASAQIDALRKVLGSEPESTKGTTKETPEQVAERLAGWQKEARQTLGSLDTPGAAAALPAGISADELESYKRDLELLALTITQIADKADLAKSDPKAKRQTDPAEWTGFDEPPPYSVLLLDELLNERDAAERKLASANSSRSNYQHLLDAATADGKAADQLVGQRISEVESAGEETRDAAKWRLAAASTRTRLVTCRIHALNLLLSKLEDTITRTRAEIVLLDKKASVARAHLRFNDEDIRSVEKITSQRKAKLDEEADKVAARIKAARISQSEARRSLDALEAEAAAGGTPVGMELARFRLEVADGRLDVLQNLAEGLENLSHLETVTLQIYKDRLALQNSIAPEERARHISALRDFHERLSAAVTALGNEFATNSADLTKLEARASSVLDDDPRLPLINEQRVLKGEKIAMYQRLIQSGESLDRMVTRWLDEAVPKEEDPGIQNVLGRAKAAFGRIWNFELFSFENTIELDSGEIQKGRVPVTAGMLIRASLFFLICYWIAARFADRIQKTLVGHKKMEDAQARTLRNWAMLAVSVLLGFATLHLLRIPLTVFAVLGGALAIGLGFGTQTLIKNFISGIIVLVERKVRVGDMIDVDGIIGRVVEVNARSSVLRGASDVETVIPNSVFLENRFTNWTLTDNKIRRAVRVGVAYGSSPRRVMEAVAEEAGRHGLVCKNPEPMVIFEDFGDSALMFCLYYWFDLHCGASALVVDSDLRIMIEKRLSEMEVNIPFPQRDLHLVSGPLEVRMAKDEE